MLKFLFIVIFSCEFTSVLCPPLLLEVIVWGQHHIVLVFAALQDIFKHSKDFITFYIQNFLGHLTISLCSQRIPGVILSNVHPHKVALGCGLRLNVCYSQKN